jgi:CRP-like cAMP-binding protein
VVVSVMGVRVVAAEDSFLIREGLRSLLSTQDDLDLVASVGSGSQISSSGSQRFVTGPLSQPRLAELGPGAVLGERALLEGGVRTSTLRAATTCKMATAAGDQLDRSALADLSMGHRREEQVGPRSHYGRSAGPGLSRG